MRTICFISFFVFSSVLTAQITIDQSLSIQQLVEDVLIGNPNFPSSNYAKSTGVDFGDVNGIATVNANGTNFPFSGVVLSTGSAIDIIGPNVDNNSQGTGAWPGDVDLEVLTGVNNTQNASIIQFDFIPAVSAVSLEFLMASEEYDQNFECSFADTFAFILTNNTNSISENLALVPGTSTAIQVTTIHPEVPGQCAAINEAYFDTYNFLPFLPAEDAPIDFNGQTTTFTILGQLIAGDSYTLKIVMADATDTAFDSALFVKGGSFGAFPVLEQQPDDIFLAEGDGDGLAIFDLTTNEAQMLGDINTSIYLFTFSYYLSLADAQQDVNAIENPEAFQNTTNPQTIYVRMTNAYTHAHTETSFQVETDGQLGVADKFAKQFTLYPNPVSHQLFITSSEIFEDLSIAVYQLNGELLISEMMPLAPREFQLDLSALSSGMYLLEIISEENRTTKKLIKN